MRPLPAEEFRREVARRLGSSDDCREEFVLALGDPAAVRAAAERFACGAPPETALEAVLQYTTRHQFSGAVLFPFYPERAAATFPERAVLAGRPPCVEVVLPDPRTRTSSLSRYHYFRMGPARGGVWTENGQIEALLRGVSLRPDPTIVSVVHPGAGRSRIFRAERVDRFPRDLLWGIHACGFHTVRHCFAGGADPGRIAVVDLGGHTYHPDLTDVIQSVRQPLASPASDSAHATIVAGVIAARPRLCRMEGCCGAPLVLYNIGVNEKIDYPSFVLALKEIAADPTVRVVNLSLEDDRYDEFIQQQITELVARKKIVVAAMGNTGTEMKRYPAAYDGVIGVGAVGQDYRRYPRASYGGNIVLSAPGEWIFSVLGSNRCDKSNCGTSMAAPMVSAAAWLALRARPELDQGSMRDLLAVSTFGGGYTAELGYGLLDLRAMAERLRPLPGCP